MSLDDRDEHVHIHEQRPSGGGVARGIIVGLLLVGLPAGAYYLGSTQNRTVITSGTRNAGDATTPPKPMEMAPGADTTTTAAQPGAAVPGSPVAPSPTAQMAVVATGAAAAGGAPSAVGDTAGRDAKVARPAANEGVLVVECVPACPQITIDGKAMGPSPLAEVVLPQGKHQVVAKFQAGNPRTHEVVIAAGQRAHVGLAPAQTAVEDYGPGENACDPSFWVAEDGSHVQKPACRLRPASASPRHRPDGAGGIACDRA